MALDYAANIDIASRAKKLSDALALAQRWTQEDRSSPKAWSKLAYVYELERNFELAYESMRIALELAPSNPSYRFKAGVIKYRSADYDSAANEFACCAQLSVQLSDDYYLDAAKIAQARCLIETGRSIDARIIIDDLPDDAATWLDGRITAQTVRLMAQQPIQKLKPRRILGPK